MYNKYNTEKGILTDNNNNPSNNDEYLSERQFDLSIDKSRNEK